MNYTTVYDGVLISRPNEFGSCLKNRYYAKSLCIGTPWGFVDTGPRRPEICNVMVYIGRLI